MTQLTLCLNLCTPCLGDHISHAHMVPKVGVISCIPPHAPCTSRTIRVCRMVGLKVVSFAVPPNDPKLYAYTRMTMACMHGKYRSFPTLDAFSRVFPVTKPYNTEFVHTLPGGPHWPCPHGPKRLGHLMHASTCTMYKQDHSGLLEGRSESGFRCQSHQLASHK